MFSICLSLCAGLTPLTKEEVKCDREATETEGMTEHCGTQHRMQRASLSHQQQLAAVANPPALLIQRHQLLLPGLIPQHHREQLLPGEGLQQGAWHMRSHMRSQEQQTATGVCQGPRHLCGPPMIAVLLLLCPESSRALMPMACHHHYATSSHHRHRLGMSPLLAHSLPHLHLQPPSCPATHSAPARAWWWR